MSSDNVNNFSINITEKDFRTLLNKVELNFQEKQSISSIFMRVSGDDGILDADEWSNFINQVDIDHDKNITVAELHSSTSAFINDKLRVLSNDLVKFYNIIEDFIKNLPEKNICKNKVEKIEYVSPTVNKYRANSKTNGTFDSQWLERDAYNSQTFEEWLKNNNYEYDWQTAEKLQKQARKHDNMHGKCAMAIRISMQDTIVSPISRYALDRENDDDNIGQNNDNESDNFSELLLSNNLFNGMNSQSYAYQYGSELANNQYFKELPHNIVKNMDLKTLPKGCVLVYDGGYKQSNTNRGQNYHKSGHISVTDGEGMDSGGGHYNIVDKKQATHIRVFVLVKPKNPKT